MDAPGFPYLTLPVIEMKYYISTKFSRYVSQVGAPELLMAIQQGKGRIGRPWLIPILGSGSDTGRRVGSLWRWRASHNRYSGFIGLHSNRLSERVSTYSL